MGCSGVRESSITCSGHSRTPVNTPFFCGKCADNAYHTHAEVCQSVYTRRAIHVAQYGCNTIYMVRHCWCNSSVLLNMGTIRSVQPT
eukprot:9475808-Pyramimonas_sp.AAC.1